MATSTDPTKVAPSLSSKFKLYKRRSSEVASLLAHVLPSSPLSVGMTPSLMTLDEGVLQTKLSNKLVTRKLEQWPTGEDPFTDCCSRAP